MAQADHTKHQRFEVLTVKRADLRGAPYNPRTIDDAASARLMRKIKEVGLVNVLVWNKRTGNLVSGHQRLAILDELEGKQDYALQVSVVDVDEKEEKTLNVFLNNASAQGDWNQSALAKLAAKFKDDLDSLGFESGEIDYILAPEEANAEDGDGDGGEDKPPRETQEGTQVLVIFSEQKPSDDFLRMIGSSTESRYVDGEEVFKRFGFMPPDEPKEKK